jgi:hypothetical protein
MSFADDVRQILHRLVELVERLQIPYMLMGGVTVPVWGIPRATYDVDMTLSLDEEGMNRFLRLAKEDGFQIEEAFQKGFRDVLDGMKKIRMEWWTATPRRVEVDVFLVTTEYQKAAFLRRKKVRIDDREVWVISPGDLILHKLTAGRPKDLADIQNVLAVQGIPDESYLRSWALRLGVERRLDKALAQAGLASFPDDRED